MHRQVFLDPKIDKHFQLLRRSGSKAILAATKAEEIINRLQSGRVIPDRVGTVTKHGELRIKGVMKYDLGNGYRLITFKRAKQLFLLYAGTHDDCHRWIENNRELTVDQIRERCVMLPISENEDDSAAEPDEAVLEEEDLDPLSMVSERDLRRVFCGLVGHLTARGVQNLKIKDER